MFQPITLPPLELLAIGIVEAKKKILFIVLLILEKPLTLCLEPSYGKYLKKLVTLLRSIVILVHEY
jgi:hypothetical protein